MQVLIDLSIKNVFLYKNILICIFVMKVLIDLSNETVFKIKFQEEGVVNFWTSSLAKKDSY